MSNKPVNIEENKLSALDIKIVDFDVQNTSLPEKYHLVVAEDTQFESTLLTKISEALAPRGFVLLEENVSTETLSTIKSFNLQVVAVTENNNKKYFLLKKVIYKYLFNIIKF